MLRQGISKNVFILGLVSFFTDLASEMIYPLVPVFLTTVLGAPVAIMGLIEGIAESTASLLKVFSGWLSDKWQRRKFFIVTGYSFSALAKIILGLAFAWPVVLLARFIDRFGKGVRTSARDALLAESSESAFRGRAFGFHRTLDTLGAVIGPLFAIMAIHFLNNNFRLIFFLAFFPALTGVFLLIFFAKEKKKTGASHTVFNFNWRGLDRSFKFFLLVSFIFALGNSSDAFLILRAKNLGLSLSLVIFIYILFNLTYAFFPLPQGLSLTGLVRAACFFQAFCFFLSFIFLSGLSRTGFFSGFFSLSME